MVDLGITIREHLKTANDPCNPSQLRGHALENAVNEVFVAIPGCDTRRNVLDHYRSSEIDILVSNRRLVRGLRQLPSYFLVECKQYDSPVSSSVVREFRAKIQDRSCKLGVLVAANGVTGSSHDRRNARQAATSALNQGIEIILITREDLEAIETAADAVRLLEDRRFDLKATTTFPDSRRTSAAGRSGRGPARSTWTSPRSGTTPPQLFLF